MAQTQAAVLPLTVVVSSTPTLSLPELKEFSAAVANGLGLETKTVVAVVGGVSRSMRVARKDHPTHLMGSLTIELQHCATAYCGAAKTSEDVFEEATEFVVSRFGHLGVFEVREAFRLAASGVLGDIDLRSYYGTFTIVTLGAVLQAYDAYRANIVKEIRRREVEQLALRAENEKQLSWNTAAWQAERRERLLTEDIECLYLTAHDFDWLTKSGELEPGQEEKAAAWARAKLDVIADYQAIGLKNRSFRDALQDVLSGKGNEGFYARRVARMKVLLVMGWIESKRSQKKVESE